MVVKFRCKISSKAVAHNGHVLQYDNCHLWIHIKCNRIKSTFIEMTQDKEHIVVGCMHRVPSMELGEFNSDYLANVSESSH